MFCSRFLGVKGLVSASLLGFGFAQAANGSDTTSASPSASNDASVVRAALVIAPARVVELRDRALSETLERDLLQSAVAVPPSAESVEEYYRRFQNRFVAPEAIEVWRILLDSEAQAVALSKQVKDSPTPQKVWSLAAREHSVDKATHFRKGYLGFVRADGTTDVPQVRVSPAVFAAAKTLEDGAYTTTPIREGEHWALVWRRGSRKEQRISLEQARPEIVQQLALSAARTTLADLLVELRGKHVSEYHPELVEDLPAPPDTGLTVQRRPREAHPADRGPTPRKTDWGER